MILLPHQSSRRRPDCEDCGLHGGAHHIRQDGKALRRLRVACEHAKKALSDQEETLVQVVDGAGVSFSAPLTRAKFEELNQDLLDRAMALVDGAVTRSGCRRPRGAESPQDMVDEIVLRQRADPQAPAARPGLHGWQGAQQPQGSGGRGGHRPWRCNSLPS